MASHNEKSAYFDRNPHLGKEILHDRRWPHLRTRTSGEVLSVGMAARILYLLLHKHTVDCIPCHFKEEFNREIDEETVLAILYQEFDLTDESLPNGEITIPTEHPAIDATGYVSGHVLPAGIYWEVINYRRHSPHLIQILVKERWGFAINQQTIVKALNDWQVQQILSGRPVPANARPGHDGRLLDELSTHAPPAMHHRTFFRNNPPPVYEPRPVVQGMTLRHPREVNPIGTHHYPFYIRGQAPSPPPFSEGARPPSYVLSQATRSFVQEASSASDSHVVGSQANTTSAGQTLELTTRAMNPSGNGVSSAADTKLHSLSEQPLATFSLSNVIGYLFESLDGKTIYPHGQHDPITLTCITRTTRGLATTRRYVLLTAILRQRPLRPADLFPDHVLTEGGGFNQTGQALWEFVREIFTELQRSSCKSSREVMSDFIMHPNLHGLCFALNHMRLRRGVTEIADAGPEALSRAVIDELILSDNLFVRLALRTYGSDFSWTATSLRTLLTNIRARRRAQPILRLVILPNPASGIPQLTGIGLSPASMVAAIDDEEPAMAGSQLRQYEEGLRYARMFVCAVIESTGTEGFFMRRLLLEDYLRDGMRAAEEGTEAYLQLRAALLRIRDMRPGAAAVIFPSKWWAAVLTNASLAIAGRSTTSHLWMVIPEFPTASIAAPSVQVNAEATQAELLQSSEETSVPSLIVFEGHFRLGHHQHNLRRLRTWNAEIRHWPTRLSVIEALLSGFVHARQQMLLRLHGRELVSIGRLEYDALAALIEEYDRELSEMRRLVRQLADLARSVDDPAATLLRQEIDRANLGLLEWEIVFGRCHSSPFSANLDLAAAASLLKGFAWELSRVRFWFSRYRHAPLDGHDLAERAALTEATVSELLGERVRLEITAASSPQSVSEAPHTVQATSSPGSGEEAPEEEPAVHDLPSEEALSNDGMDTTTAAHATPTTGNSRSAAPVRRDSLPTRFAGYFRCAFARERYRRRQSETPPRTGNQS